MAYGAICLMDFHKLLEKAAAKNALAFSQFQQVRRRLISIRDHFLFFLFWCLTIGVHSSAISAVCVLKITPI